LCYHGVSKEDFKLTKLYSLPAPAWYVIGFVPSVHEPEDVRNFTRAFQHSDESDTTSWALKNSYRRCGSHVDEQTVYKLTLINTNDGKEKNVAGDGAQPQTIAPVTTVVAAVAPSSEPPATTNTATSGPDSNNVPLVSFDVERSVDIPFVTQFTGITIPEKYRLDVNYIKKDILCKCAINPAIQYTFMICSKPDKSANWLLAQTTQLSKIDLVIAKTVIEEMLGLSWDRMHFVAHSSL